MDHSKEFRLDNIENYSSTVKAARNVLREFKRHYPKEIDCYRLRIGKTTYCFVSLQRMKNKLKTLDTCEYELANPGEPFPVKPLSL